MIFAARKSGDPNNDEALIISQNMSVLFGLAAIGMYLYAGYFKEDPDNTLPRMRDSQFLKVISTVIRAPTLGSMTTCTGQ